LGDLDHNEARSISLMCENMRHNEARSNLIVWENQGERTLRPAPRVGDKVDDYSPFLPVLSRINLFLLARYPTDSPKEWERGGANGTVLDKREETCGK